MIPLNYEILPAGKKDSDNGWTISTKTLLAIRNKIIAEQQQLIGLEEIENVLIAITGYKRNPNSRAYT